MEILNYNALDKLNYDGYILKNAPETILQFGTGNFLRSFFDLFIDVLNEKVDFNSKIVVVSSISKDVAKRINDQDGLYTSYMKGLSNGIEVNEKRIISSISRCVDANCDYDAFLHLAKNKDLRVIVSNTTEAGIYYDKSAKLLNSPHNSYPAKLTRFLYERFKLGLDGFIILPCELTDKSGDLLLSYVKKHIKQWGISDGFTKWLEDENIFANCLVDKIVTGFPENDIEKINTVNGYIDNMLLNAEVFAFWAIEAPQSILKQLPFDKVDLPIVVTDDYEVYKQRKVRILNGLHSSMVFASHFIGETIVRDAISNDVISKFCSKVVSQEIIPTIDLPIDDLNQFAYDVFDRFKNPFIDHKLLDITLNSTSKMRLRIVPTIKDYLEKNGVLPMCLTFSFASYLHFYRDKSLLNDEGYVKQFFEQHNEEDAEMYVKSVLSNSEMWGENLNLIDGFYEQVLNMLVQMENEKMVDVMKKLLV